MKRLARHLAVIMVIAIIAMPIHVYAADSKVSISGGKTAAVGSTVTVTVVYSGNSIGFVNGQMTYDNSKLEYISGGTSQGDAGLVQLKTYSTDATGKIIFKIRFKAVGAGKQNLNVSTIETQNIDGDQSMGAPSAKMAFTVTNATAGTQASQSSQATETTAAATQNATTQTMESVTSAEGQDVSDKDNNSTLFWIIAAIVIIGIISLCLWLLYFRKKKAGSKKGSVPTAETLQNEDDDEEEIDWSKILK